MTEPKTGTTRRDFLKTTGTGGRGLGPGGRGDPVGPRRPRTTRSRSPWSAAAAAAPARRSNALSAKSGPIKLVAMADVFKDRLDGSFDAHQEGARATRSTSPTTASSSASTATRRRWTASSRATW